MRTEYSRFGLWYVAGRRVTHLHSDGELGTKCGVRRLSLKVRRDGSVPLCKRCIRTVKIVKALGRKVALYRYAGVVRAWCEDTAVRPGGR
jgi:hypothetical protein